MSNIIDFPKANTRAEAEKGLSVKRKPMFCRCVAVEVDEQARTLECRNCGADVGAFDWALTLCKDWQGLENQKQRLKAEIKAADKSLAETKRQLKNAKASLNRAKKSAPVPKPELRDTQDWVGGLDEFKAELFKD